MDLRYVSADLRKLDRTAADAICVSFFDDERPLRGAAGLVDWRLCGLLSRSIERGQVSGAEGEVTLLPARPRLPFDKVFSFGLGPAAGFGPERYRAALERIFETLERARVHTVVLALPGRSTNRIEPDRAAELFWAVAHERAQGDDIVLVDDPESQKALAAVLDRQRKRI